MGNGIKCLVQAVRADIYAVDETYQLAGLAFGTTAHVAVMLIVVIVFFII